MSAISVPNEMSARVDIKELRGNYMTTSAVAKLCGVSRFTVINWANKGKVKVVRTVGGHRRIHALDAVALVRGLDTKERASSLDPEGQDGQQKPTVSGKEERGNCLTVNEDDQCTIAKKKGILRCACYTIGRGMHIFGGKASRTISGHRRTHALNSMALVGGGERERASSPDPERQGGQQKTTVNGKRECGNCLTVNEDDRYTIAKNKGILRGVCYATGRGAHIFRRKARN